MDRISMNINQCGCATVKFDFERSKHLSRKLVTGSCDDIIDSVKNAYLKNPEIARGVLKGLMGIIEHVRCLDKDIPQKLKDFLPSWQKTMNNSFNPPVYNGRPRPIWLGEVAYEFSAPGEIKWGYNKWFFGSYRLFLYTGKDIFVCYTPNDAIEALNEVMAEAVLFDCSTHEIQCIRLRDYCLRINEHEITDKLLKFQSYDWADAVNPYKSLPCKRQ